MDEVHEADNTCDIEDQSLFRARNSLETTRIREAAAVAVAANPNITEVRTDPEASTSQPQDGSDVAQDATVMDDEDDCQIYDVIIECSNLFQDIEATARGSVGDCTVALADHPDLGNLTDSIHNDEPISVRDYVARLNRSLEHWSDYTGALALPQASLDSRLRDHHEIKGMVLELLDMITRNLSRS